MRSFIAYTYGVWLTVEILIPDPWYLFGGVDFIVPLFNPSATGASFLIHVVSYAILALLFFWAKIEPRTRQRIFWLFIFLLLHGFVSEALQGFVPGRWTNPVDAVANTVGVGFGGFAYFEWRVIKRFVSAVLPKRGYQE